jgi:hypothetical protein
MRGVVGLCLLAAALPGLAAAGPRGLDGTWTNAWYTQLERPKGFKALVATPEEAEAYEAPRRALNGMPPSKADDLGQAESEFNEGGPGLARIRGQIRSSWIVEPADGLVPWIPEVKARYGIGKPPVETFDHVEERPAEERCLTARGAFAPILNSPDTNYVQIVETPQAVAIVSEKNHDVRVVRIGEAAGWTPPGGVWGGVATGRWEGKTLVVTNTGVRFSRVRGLILTEGSVVTERFTRTGPKELTYVFEVTDPALYTRPWTGEMVFRAAEAPMYEIACHEGNYSLRSILSAARQAEAGAKAAP